MCGLCLKLAACSGEAADNTDHALNKIESNTSITWNKARDLVGFPKKPKPLPPVEKTQTRYCYKSYVDITCYAQPVHGEEDRLVAYQGNTGQTGYILPSHIHRDDTAILPPLKSVNVVTLPKIATDTPGKKQLKEIIFDPAELQPKELVPQKPQ